MKFSKLVVPCFILVASCLTTAKADCGGLGLAYLYGYGGHNHAGISSFVPAPPYFALHPPVYYGQRYTRPYGASPFAAWPQLQGNSGYRPARHVDRAQTIANPYATGGSVLSGAGGVVQTKANQSKVIENPFYKPAVQYTSN